MRTVLRLLFFAFLLFVEGIRFSLAQLPEKLAFEHLTTEQGLSKNDIHHIIQDKNGYLWFATTDGLNRYDGYNFTVYKYDAADTTTIAQNTILKLYEDKEGNIWTALVGEGICKFDPRTEKFTRFPPNVNSPTSLHDGIVDAFYEDEDGFLWVGTNRIAELRRLDKHTGKFSPYNYSPIGRKENKEILCINNSLKDNEGFLWLATSHGLYQTRLPAGKLDASSKAKHVRYSNDPNDPYSISGTEVHCLYQDHNGVLWIGTDNGLNSFDKKTGRFVRYLHNDKDRNSLSSNFIDWITEDLQGNLWIGTENGLNGLDVQRTSFTAYFHDPADPTSLNSNYINSLLIDRQGVLWVGATNGGISRFDPNRRSFALFRQNPLDPNSLNNNTVKAICEDRSGAVWIGTDGGGLNRLEKKTGKFTHYRHKSSDPQSLSSDRISALLEDKQGNLWIACGDGLINYLNTVTGEIKRYQNNSDFFKHFRKEYVFTMYQDKAGVLWLGTEGSLQKVDPLSGQVTYYTKEPSNPNSLSDYWVYAICEDRKGNLWIGTYANALNKFDPKTGKFTHYKHEKNNPKSISSHTIRSIFRDTKGNMWFGTLGGGLNRFNPQTETFTAYTEKDGLANNSVYSILEDNDGNLWLATNKGISRFDIEKKTFINYDVSDGLQSNEFSSSYYDTGVGFKGKDGKLYFGGSKGFNVIDPIGLKTNQAIPPIVITQFKVFDKLMAGKSEWERIELGFEENFVSFEFAALDYTNPQKNQYAYQLVGVDRDWVYSGSRRYASYTNLTPGQYLFKVKGSNNDGIWNQRGKSVTLIIHPPWWKTFWAYLGYGLVLIAGLVLARREIIKRERLRANLRIQQVEATKWQELDGLKSRFFANISHEFRTPLSLIAAVIEKLKKQDSQSERQSEYGLISRNVKQLLQMINQLLDLSGLEAGKLQLQLESTQLSALLQRQAGLLVSLFESRGIDYSHSVPLQPLWVKADTEKLERILTNLLSNSAKFTPGGGRVRFRASYDQLGANKILVKVVVEDNGIGIAPEQMERIFDRFYQADSSATRSYEGTGIGLALAKELAELHGGQIQVESRMREGSAFTLTLPLELTDAPIQHPIHAATDQDSNSQDGIAQLDADTATSLSQSLTTESSSKYNYYSQVLSDKEVQASSYSDLRENNESNYPNSSDGKVQILVVEDHQDLREFISTALRETYQVGQAVNGMEGYKLALEQIPDLIISDVMMPGMDGVTLCDKLKTDDRTSHIPVILLTARADETSKLTGLRTGADEYLTKPFSLEELQLRVKNMLQTRRNLQHKYSAQFALSPPDTTSGRPAFDPSLSAKDVTVISADEQFLQKALLIMETNMADAEFDVEAFSRELAMSRSQLYRKFMALTGQGPGELIKSLRLKKAAVLLKAQAGNVSEIAYQVGFTNLPYFSKAFKEEFGQTPSEFGR